MTGSSSRLDGNDCNTRQGHMRTETTKLLVVVSTEKDTVIPMKLVHLGRFGRVKGLLATPLEPPLMTNGLKGLPGCHPKPKRPKWPL